MKVSPKVEFVLLPGLVSFVKKLGAISLSLPVQNESLSAIACDDF